jgi:hypothetical protein
MAGACRIHVVTRPGRVAWCWGVALALLPTATHAQSRLDFTHSVALMQLYDDNLFATPSRREADSITRLSPTVGVEYRSATLTVSGRSGLDAEMYQRHAQFNTAGARVEGLIEARYVPSKRLSLGVTTSYLGTQTPSELNLLTGLVMERAPASRLRTTQSLTWSLGPRSSAVLDHSYVRDQVASHAANDSQSAAAGLVRRFGGADTGRLDYTVRRFVFGADTTSSHAFTAGWSRAVTPLTSLEFQAGPRVRGDRLGAEIAAGLRHRFRRGDVALGYLQTETMVAGRAGSLTAEGVTATFGRQLVRALWVRGGPSVFRVSNDEFAATVYRMSFEATWRLGRHLSLTGSHQFSLQLVSLGALHREEVSHNAFLLRVAAGSAGH